MSFDITERSDHFVEAAITGSGSEILSSDIFKRAQTETHHARSTLSDHTLNVCILSLKLSRLLQKCHISVNDDDLVKAALCHDLGMVGREEKYDGRLDSWRSHSARSVEIARELIPDLSENSASMIRSHMWPLCGLSLDSKEAVILTAADKAASVADWVSALMGRSYKQALKEGLMDDQSAGL